jgi:alpha-beta hydrolase superfamily lysophospholipase
VENANRLITPISSRIGAEYPSPLIAAPATWDSAPMLVRLERPDLSLALHQWLPAAPRAVIFYVHGLQSHGGWLFESGPRWAELGIAVLALDRRGSGQSEGARGDVAAPSVWIEDYLAAMEQVRSRHLDLPLLLFGQSMGGLLAGAIACDPRACHDALVLSAPALGQRFTPPAAPHGARIAVPLQDRWYTGEPRFLEFMAKDPWMVREISDRLLVARAALDDLLERGKEALAKRPAALIVPRKDQTMDAAAARATFHRLVPHGLLIELPSEDHYLEFSPERERFSRIVAALAVSRGYASVE